jgi:hypothetical protein
VRLELTPRAVLGHEAVQRRRLQVHTNKR